MKKFSFLFLFALLFVFVVVGCDKPEDQPKVKYYEVTFDTGTDQLINPQTVKENELAVKPTDPTNGDKVFGGWYLDNNEYDFTTPVTKDIQLVAKWNELEYTVSFYGGENGDVLIETQSVKKGEDAIEPAADKIPTVSGKEFVRWDTIFTNVQSDLTVTARYSELEYTITIISLGEVIETAVVLHGDTYQLPDPKYIDAPGYEFDSWENEEELLMGVTSDVTVTAIWTAIEYDLVFMAGNNELTDLTDTYTVEDEVTLPNISGEGYTLEGWYADITVDSKTTKIEKGSMGDKVFYLKANYEKVIIDTTLANVPFGTKYTYTDGKEYTMGIVLCSSLNQAFAIPVAGDNVVTITLEAGEYNDDITIAASNFALVGPNAEVDPTSAATRNEEAVFNGKITLAADVDNITISGIKFAGNAQILGEKSNNPGSSSSPADNHENFVFKNNIVNVTLDKEEVNGFMVLAEAGNSYGFNTQIVNNLFTMADNTKALNMLWMDNTEDLKLLNNVFRNIPVRAVYINDTSKGLSGLDTEIKGNVFENIGGSGFWANWVSPVNGSTTGKFNISDNTFSNVGTTNADYALYFGSTNNSDKIAEFNVSNNTFISGASYVYIHRCHNESQVVLDSNTFVNAPKYNYVICENKLTTAEKITDVQLVNTKFIVPPTLNKFVGNVDTAAIVVKGDVVVDATWAGKADGEKVIVDEKEYEIGVNAFATIAAVFEKDYAEQTTITVAAGSYAESFTIKNDDIVLVGPAFGYAGTAAERPAEAIISGAITLASEIDNVVIQGFKFEGASKITGNKGTAGTADVPADNHENFIFQNNVVSVTGQFMFMEAAGNSYDYNMQIIGNLFELTVETTNANELIWLDNTEDLKVLNNVFRNIPTRVIYHNDTDKGLSGTDVQINGNTFENIGGDALNINWFSPTIGSTNATLVIDNNTFKDVNGVAVYLAKCNNSDAYDVLSVSNNLFTGTISTAVKVDRMVKGINYVMENNIFESVPTTAYFNLVNTTTAGSAPEKVLNVNNNVYKENGEVILSLDASKFLGDVDYRKPEATVKYYLATYESQSELATTFLTEFYNWLVAKGHITTDALSLEAFLDTEGDDVALNGKWYDYMGSSGEGSGVVGTNYLSTYDYLWLKGGNSETIDENYFVNSAENIAKWGPLLDVIGANFNKYNNRVWADKLGGAYDLLKWVIALTGSSSYNSADIAFNKYLESSACMVSAVHNPTNHTILEAPAKEGFTASWNTKADGSGQTITELSATEFVDLNLYLIYTPVVTE